MQQVKELAPHEMGLFARFVNWAARKMYGKEMAPLKIMAHNPRFLLPYAQMGTFAQGKTELPGETRQLAMHLVSHLNSCAWCVDFGSAIAQKQGWSAEKMHHVLDYRTHPLFTDAERAALAFAEEATQVGARVSDETFEELHRHYSDRQIVELAAAVAAENFFNRMNASLGVEQQGFCELPAFRPRGVAVAAG
jgi:AhpD family alkylhydroperoxidase